MSLLTDDTDVAELASCPILAPGMCVVMEARLDGPRLLLVDVYFPVVAHRFAAFLLAVYRTELSQKLAKGPPLSLVLLNHRV